MVQIGSVVEVKMGSVPIFFCRYFWLQAHESVRCTYAIFGRTGL